MKPKKDPRMSDAAPTPIAPASLTVVGEEAESVPTDNVGYAGAALPSAGGSPLAYVRRKSVWIPLVLLLALAALFASGFHLYRQVRAEEERIAAQERVIAAKAAAKRAAEQEAAENAALEKKLVGQFDQLMTIRGQILNAEAQGNAAVGQAKAAVVEFDKRTAARKKKVEKLNKEYDDEYRRVSEWNSDPYHWYNQLPYPDAPNYPDQVAAPNFQPQINALKASDAALREATAGLMNLEVGEPFNKLVTQLEEASASISEEVLHNADALSTSVEPASADSEDGNAPSYVDMKVFGTLRTASAKAVFTVINNVCLAFVSEHNLDLRLYDLAGGRDVNAGDSSMLASAQPTATVSQ